MKGMQKISRGKSFIGVLNYCFEREAGKNKGQLIGGNMDSTTPETLAREFFQISNLRKDIEKPVWHNSLRLPEGEIISDKKWRQIGEEYIKKMGMEDHQFCLVKHDDENGHHVHIIVNRVSVSQKVFLGKNDNLKSTKVISSLEKLFRLRPTKGADEKKEVANPSKAEIEMAIRTEELPGKVELQKLLDDAIDARPESIEGFKNECEKRNVEVEINTRNGKDGIEISGLKFRLFNSEFWFKGSALGQKYKAAAIDGVIKNAKQIISNLTNAITSPTIQNTGISNTRNPEIEKSDRAAKPITPEVTIPYQSTFTQNAPIRNERKPISERKPIQQNPLAHQLGVAPVNITTATTKPKIRPARAKAERWQVSSELVDNYKKFLEAGGKIEDAEREAFVNNHKIEDVINARFVIQKLQSPNESARKIIESMPDCPARREIENLYKSTKETKNNRDASNDYTRPKM